MNAFNKVFTTVQKYCHSHGSVIGNDGFQIIASEAEVTLERLHFYLDCLQQTGVIIYSAENKTVELTEKGTKVLRVFP